MRLLCDLLYGEVNFDQQLQSFFSLMKHSLLHITFGTISRKFKESALQGPSLWSHEYTPEDCAHAHGYHLTCATITVLRHWQVLAGLAMTV